MEIGSDTSKILVNSFKTIYQHMDEWGWMNGKTLEEVDQFKYLGSTQTEDGTSIKEVTIRLAY